MDWGTLGLHIYDALQLNACDSFGAFPIQHDAVINWTGGPIDAFFSGIDSTTVDHTGFYSFTYLIRATDARGGVSIFRFSGKLNATCTALDALPQP